MNLDIDILEWAQVLYEPARYKIIAGGRGSGKSEQCAKALIADTFKHSKCLYICGRVIKDAIDSSVRETILYCLDQMGIAEEFVIGREKFVNKQTKSTILFKGLGESTIINLKSIPNIRILWFEEANSISPYIWRALVPTVRKEFSEIWATFNPTSKHDFIYDKFFVKNFSHPSLVVTRLLTWRDNPFFPKELMREKDMLEKTDYEEYLHVYEGQLLENDKSAVFSGRWVVEKCSNVKGSFYYGLDFGFSVDPTVAIRCVIVQDVLYITHEAVSFRLTIEQMGGWLLNAMPDDLSSSIVYADSSRPENIDYINRNQSNFHVASVKKGKNSVIQGVEYIKSFRSIVIDPSCKNMIFEFNNYKFAVVHDLVTTKILDKDNHGIDALRYALEKESLGRGKSLFDKPYNPRVSVMSF